MGFIEAHRLVWGEVIESFRSLMNCEVWAGLVVTFEILVFVIFGLVLLAYVGTQIVYFICCIIKSRTRRR